MRKILLTALLCLITVPMLPSIATAQSITPEIEADQSAARIMAYFTVGRDDTPASNITVEQFSAHIAELSGGNYTVLPLSDIISAYNNGSALPDNTVALTFDGGDKSILQYAIPLMEAKNLPYTLFIAPSRADQKNSPYMDWDALKKIAKSPLATLGLHDAVYSDLSMQSAEQIKRTLNNATSRFREKAGANPLFFAYPFGVYNKAAKDIISSYGFEAAFGQQSGVAYVGSDLFALPRFTMTENYGDEARFKMTANALPLPVKDITPSLTIVDQELPPIGFTLSDKNISLDNLSCFASGQDKPSISVIGSDRVEIRLKDHIGASRFRINCTLPAAAQGVDENPRWRWLGMLLTRGETLNDESE